MLEDLWTKLDEKGYKTGIEDLHKQERYNL